MNIKLEMKFVDRVGIVADISALLAKQGLNILSMEVKRREKNAFIYVEIEGKTSISKESLMKTLVEIQGLEEIKFIKFMPHEARENKFRVVLDNISDGVISIDLKGKITTINRAAQKALACENQHVIGEKINTLDLPDYDILDCLQGKIFSNTKKSTDTGKSRIHYLATGRPIRNSEAQIIGAVEIARGMHDIKRLTQSISDMSPVTFGNIIGQNPAIMSAIAFSKKIAETDSIISLRGDSGTGKELFARAIHTSSKRVGLFVPINCAAMPEQLLESELFGYAGGTFTGGKREGKAGLFEVAHDGTIFLDEIAEMPLGAQAKILRVIQEKKVRRIGDAKEIVVNPRIITATNRNLEKMMEDKLFRRDLYYRINVLPIHIPPLNERIEDIPLLVDHFLFQLASKLEKKLQNLTVMASHKLCRHSWPGNVRELKNVIERASILSESNEIDIDNILFSQDINGNLEYNPSRLGSENLKNRSLKKLLSEYEKEIIVAALGKHSSIRQTARSLGISHTALLNKLKKYQIRVETAVIS